MTLAVWDRNHRTLLNFFFSIKTNKKIRWDCGITLLYSYQNKILLILIDDQQLVSSSFFVKCPSSSRATHFFLSPTTPRRQHFTGATVFFLGLPIKRCGDIQLTFFPSVVFSSLFPLLVPDPLLSSPVVSCLSIPPPFFAVPAPEYVYPQAIKKGDPRK